VASSTSSSSVAARHRSGGRRYPHRSASRTCRWTGCWRRHPCCCGARCPSRWRT
jgi:hypothetical protein